MTNDKQKAAEEYFEKRAKMFDVNEFSREIVCTESFKSGADWAIGVMSEKVKSLEEDCETYAQGAEKYGDLSCCYSPSDVVRVVDRAFDELQAKCAAYERALRVFAESDKCTLELLTYHSMSGRNIRREVHDGKQFAIEALNEGGK